MKKYIFLSVASIFMMLSTQKANAQSDYDFSAINNGQIIYYNITSSTPPLTVEVTDKDVSYIGDIVIPGNVTNEGNTYAVTAIGDIAFAGCAGLTSVTIPNSVISIGKNAFTYCKELTSVTIPNSVISIGDFAFDDCSGLTSVTIGNSVTTIGWSAFGNCIKLTSVTIPNSVISIGMHAFILCYGLTSITIGNSVTTIGERAFGCKNLTEIHVKAVNPPQIYGNTFETISESIPVYVCGSVETYRNAPYWSAFTNILPDNNCNVGIANVYGENGITIYPNPAIDNISITLPENVHSAVFTLYDMQGKVLIKQEVKNQETVAINKLASGIYIYNVRTDKQNHTGKLIRK
jgi:hypothetical protein